MVHGKYVEIEPIILDKLESKDIHVFYFCGGRGIGKTYGGLHMLRRIGEGHILRNSEKDGGKFLYLRRTAVEAQSVAEKEMCPFKKYNAQEGTHICADFISKLGIGNFYLDEDKEVHLGYAAGLSTFSNLRGVDFSDVTLVFYDEAIPEKSKNKRPLSNEGNLLLNLIETINRNRALEGLPEIVVVMCSNPIDLGSTLLTQLDLSGIFTSMIFKKQQFFTMPERSLYIARYINHPVSQEKKDKSFLFKFAKDLGFSEQTLTGEFTDNNLSVVEKHVKLQEYIPEFIFSDICVYRHKSKEQYYLSKKCMACSERYTAHQRELVRMRFYWLYKLLVTAESVKYDSYQTKMVFDSLIGYKGLIPAEI